MDDNGSVCVFRAVSVKYVHVATLEEEVQLILQCIAKLDLGVNWFGEHEHLGTKKRGGG
jgi:hypothetical protein